MLNRLLTPGEVAGLLSVSRNTLHLWSKNKIYLQPIKVGKQLRYAEEDVVAFIESRASGDSHKVSYKDKMSVQTQDNQATNDLLKEIAGDIKKIVDHNIPLSA